MTELSGVGVCFVGSGSNKEATVTRAGCLMVGGGQLMMWEYKVQNSTFMLNALGSHYRILGRTVTLSDLNTKRLPLAVGRQQMVKTRWGQGMGRKTS